MDKLAQRKESNTFYILDRSHGLNEIAGCQVQNRRCQMRYRFGQVLSRLDRSILVMIAGLFLSVSAFSQTPGGPAGPNPTSEQTIQFPAKQDNAPVDPQVKLILDRVSASRVFHLSNIEEPRRASFPYSNFAGSPESVSCVEDREMPGPGWSLPIRMYTPNARTGLQSWVFFHGGGFVAAGLDTYDVPLRAVTNRCDCPVVSVGYRLGPENRYTAAPENPYAATRWMAGHTAEIDQNLRIPLSATPPGTLGLPPMPGSPQTPTSEAFRAGGNIDLTTLAARFRVRLRFRRLN
jgi:alpha/beta hydrolase fold